MAPPALPGCFKTARFASDNIVSVKVGAKTCHRVGELPLTHQDTGKPALLLRSPQDSVEPALIEGLRTGRGQLGK